MSGNWFGHSFRFATWGESHGPAIGAMVDGVPPGLPLTEADIQVWLDKRRPGTSKYVTQRQEPDSVRILSGVFEGKTTGTPIALIVDNVDQRSKDYSDIKDLFRPGHADYTYFKKYGLRDYRGGGRASARETAMRVAAGAIARKILLQTFPEFRVRGAMTKIGPLRINPDKWDWAQVDQNPFWCPDESAVPMWSRFLDMVRKEGSSAGAVVEIHASGIPAGLGAPIYSKLDADLAAAIMGINAVKGVEIGDGFGITAIPGEDAHDEMRMKDVPGKNAREPEFLSNHAGGILGGISTGQDIVVRFAVKPTSSVLTPRRTVSVHGEDATVATKGRHDPCVGIRSVPVGEAMVACVLADHWMRHRAQCG
ncbi:MAG: chorismate synthase [Candidatus Odyssella sp.]|nr:chorismate synthase [Candidatus Odyssella sp.]